MYSNANWSKSKHVKMFLLICLSSSSMSLNEEMMLNFKKVFDSLQKCSVSNNEESTDYKKSSEFKQRSLDKCDSFSREYFEDKTKSVGKDSDKSRERASSKTSLLNSDQTKESYSDKSRSFNLYKDEKSNKSKKSKERSLITKQRDSAGIQNIKDSSVGNEEREVFYDCESSFGDLSVRKKDNRETKDSYKKEFTDSREFVNKKEDVSSQGKDLNRSNLGDKKSSSPSPFFFSDLQEKQSDREESTEKRRKSKYGDQTTLETSPEAFPSCSGEPSKRKTKKAIVKEESLSNVFFDCSDFDEREEDLYSEEEPYVSESDEGEEEEDDGLSSFSRWFYKKYKFHCNEDILSPRDKMLYMYNESKPEPKIWEHLYKFDKEVDGELSDKICGDLELF